MKLVHFTLADQFHFGMMTDSNEFIDLDTACRDYFGVNPVKGADPSRFRDMQQFFQGGADSVQITKKILEYIDRRRKMGWTPRAATGARFLFKAEEGIKLLAPVVRGAKIYCLADELEEPRGRADRSPRRSSRTSSPGSSTASSVRASRSC